MFDHISHYYTWLFTKLTRAHEYSAATEARMKYIHYTRMMDRC